MSKKYLNSALAERKANYQRRKIEQTGKRSKKEFKNKWNGRYN